MVSFSSGADYDGFLFHQKENQALIQVSGKSVLSWSSGKDASFALFRLLEKGIRPGLLLTTVNQDFGRVSMHGLRIELLRRQAEAVDIPLWEIPLRKDVSMEEYSRIMEENLQKLKDLGYDTVYFGDIFLEDLRKFREDQLKKIGMKAGFPVWGYDTREMAMEIIDQEIEAVVVTVSGKKLDKSYVGRDFDRRFLCDLPSDVDWCGENGEFHTFVHNAPFFKHPVKFHLGEKIRRTYKACSKDESIDNNRQTRPWETEFWYVDVLPA